MERIRKGNDIGILWEILTESGQPYDLTDKDLTLYLAYMYGKEKVEDFSVSGNVLSWTYRGKSQKHTGVYSLILVENEGKDGMNTVDECGAFELVRCSCQEGSDAESHVKIETVSLKSAIALNSIIVDSKLDIKSLNPIANAPVARAIASMPFKPRFFNNEPAAYLDRDNVVNAAGTVAMGRGNTVRSPDAFAGGRECDVAGSQAFGMGFKCKTSANASQAFGYKTRATRQGQMACGACNKIDDDAMFIVGISEDENFPMTGFKVSADGKTHVMVDGELIPVSPIADEELDELFND